MMKWKIPGCTAVIFVFLFSFKIIDRGDYFECYTSSLKSFSEQQKSLSEFIRTSDLNSEASVEQIRKQISKARLKMKEVDFWLRYLEPIAYKKINGPLPVEWETEVFEKWEKPYKREAAGLTLAELYLDEDNINRDTLKHLIEQSIEATKIFLSDSITQRLSSFDHFFFVNRLFLMNLAAIYTTGFECPNADNVITELRYMLPGVETIYDCYDKSFPATPLSAEYHALYVSLLQWVNNQPEDFEKFDHFTFVKDYINPLFGINQQLIQKYKAVSRSFNDYSLTNTATSIFDKSLYDIQHTKGIFSLVDNEETLQELDRVGKLLFYDPILSANNQRSCASCHNPKQHFTDTTVQTALQFDRVKRLTRNTPSLVNVIYNHLIMLDGKHISLQAQAEDVTTNPIEMASTANELAEKVMSCKEYKSVFKKLLKDTPGETEVNIKHIVSAVTFYYSKFSNYYSPFDEAMEHHHQLNENEIRGFNLFMSKAECATCHFVPFFNGIKPPYTNSEFEVLGVPADTAFTHLSSDSGRYGVHPAAEMQNAFRTGTLRNIQFTKPYMHNGIFNTLEEVVDFYDTGGGAGRNLDVPNQTLSGDSLQFTKEEKEALISFMFSLNEDIRFEAPPAALPQSSIKALNLRKVGGEY